MPILLSPFKIVPVSLLTRELNFKIMAIAEIIAIVVSSTVAIALAYLGYGVWSLVIKQIIAAVIRLPFFGLQSNRDLECSLAKKRLLIYLGLGCTF